MQLEDLKGIESEQFIDFLPPPLPIEMHMLVHPHREEINIDPFGDHAAPPELQKELHKLLHPAYRYKPHIVLDELNLFRLNLPHYEIERAVDAKINPPTERK